MLPIDVEVCIDAARSPTVQRSVSNAFRGGAARIELCSDLAHGGLTPQAAYVRIARTTFGRRRGLQVMIRPRPGDFHYTLAERATMEAQIDEAAEAGADGVVFGALAGGHVDVAMMRPLVRTAQDRRLSVTFHRAFDAVADPGEALDVLIDLGIARVLTSGTPWGQDGGALSGRDRLAETIRQAAGRIEVVIGGGISPANVAAVLDGLPLAAGPVSVHAYSSLLKNGVTDAALVAELARCAALRA